MVATPNPHLQGRAGARPWWADPCQARSRRGLSAAGSAGWGRRRICDTQQGQAAAYGSPLRGAAVVSSIVAARPQQSFINGCGCAAASIGGTGWAMPAGATSPSRPIHSCAVTPLPAAVPGYLHSDFAYAASRRPPLSPQTGAVCQRPVLHSGASACKARHLVLSKECYTFGKELP